MSHRGLIALPPTRWDLVLSRACARAATPEIERTPRVVTWLADEKSVLGATLLFWTYARLSRRDIEIARRAEHVLCCVALAGVLPHLFKCLVDRKRPDRVVVHGRRHGIPRSGDAWNLFPSEHAVHLGAIAGSLAGLCPDSSGLAVDHSARSDQNCAARALRKRRRGGLGTRRRARQGCWLAVWLMRASSALEILAATAPTVDGVNFEVMFELAFLK
jgi:hypothetical protein